MTTEQIIRELRGMANDKDRPPHEVFILVAAIRALGGQP